MSPTLVQSKALTGTSGTTLSGSLNSATGSGNCLIVCVGTRDTSASPTVSGITLGGSADNFASANSAHSTNDGMAAIWADPNCASGQTSVVISLTGDSGVSPNTAAWLMEWSGLLTSSPLDAHPAGANGAVATSWSSGSTGTLAQASELVIGCVAVEAASGTLSTPGSPWTELTQQGAITGCLLGVGYQVVSATTALTYNGTTSSAAVYGVCIASFKAAAAAGGPPLPLMMVFP